MRIFETPRPLFEWDPSSLEWQKTILESERADRKKKCDYQTKEYKELVKKFGEDYVKYLKSVGRL